MAKFCLLLDLYLNMWYPLLKNLELFQTRPSFFSPMLKCQRCCGFPLVKYIQKIILFISFNDLQRVTHAFVTSCLDYCSTLFKCQNMITWWQGVQNASARLLIKSQKPDPISPILAFLHGLPIFFRIDFKILLLTFRPSFFVKHFATVVLKSAIYIKLFLLLLFIRLK